MCVKYDFFHSSKGTLLSFRSLGGGRKKETQTVLYFSNITNPLIFGKLTLNFWRFVSQETICFMYLFCLNSFIEPKLWLSVLFKVIALVWRCVCVCARGRVVSLFDDHVHYVFVQNTNVGEYGGQIQPIQCSLVIEKKTSHREKFTQ